VLRKLGAYLLWETIPLYLFGVAAFCLLISIDYLSVMARFLLDSNASLAAVGLLLLYKVPWFLHLSLPIAGVFAVLLATGRLARDSELKAAYALGVPPAALLWPLAGFGLVISGLALLNNGYLEPLAERRYSELVDSFYYTRPRAEAQVNVAFSLPDGSIYHAAEIRSNPDEPDSASLRGVFLLLPDGTTVTAPGGTWLSSERVWLLEDAQRAPPAGQGDPVLAGSLRFPFAFSGDPASTLTRQTLLTLGELQERIRNVRAAGGQLRELDYELQRRVADAFSAACFVLVASLLGLGVRSRSAAFAWTIGLLVVFWALWILSASLFDNGVLPAAGAAWLTPLLVTGLGTLLAAWRLRR
jgi:lipopolysaccharide export LptBFGC system permease protein LptF